MVGAEVKNDTIAFCKMFDMLRKSMHKLAIQICNINHIRFVFKENSYLQAYKEYIKCILGKRSQI